MYTIWNAITNYLYPKSTFYYNKLLNHDFFRNRNNENFKLFVEEFELCQKLLNNEQITTLNKLLYHSENF